MTKTHFQDSFFWLTMVSLVNLPLVLDLNKSRLDPSVFPVDFLDIECEVTVWFREETSSFFCFSTLSNPSTLLRIHASIYPVQKFSSSSLGSCGFWLSWGGTYLSLSPSRLSNSYHNHTIAYLGLSNHHHDPYSNLDSHPTLNSLYGNLLPNLLKNALLYCTYLQSVVRHGFFH